MRQGPRDLPRRSGHARRQRHFGRIPRNAPRRQPGDGQHLRGHARRPRPDHRPGDHRPGGLLTMQRPLEGVRVVELARILAGPWAGQLLADLGAEVIKVERPEVGDDTRQWGPPFVEGPDGSNLGAAYFHACNRGKRSVVADIADPTGQALVRDLARDADVLIENFKVGGLARYGLDAESL